MKKSEFIAARDKVLAQYTHGIANLTGRPNGFSKKTAGDLVAGYTDGLNQGAEIALALVGAVLEEG